MAAVLSAGSILSEASPSIARSERNASPHHVVTTDQALRVAKQTPTPLVFLMPCFACCPRLLGRSVILLAGNFSAILAQAHAYTCLSRAPAARIRSCHCTRSRRQELWNACIHAVDNQFGIRQHLVQIIPPILFESTRCGCPSLRGQG